MDDPNLRNYPGEDHFYKRDKISDTSRQPGNLLKWLLAMVGVLVAIVIIMAAVLIHLVSVSQANTPNQIAPGIGTSTISAPTQAAPTPIPATPTATPTPTSLPSGTVLCQSGSSGGWSGWPISGSWTILNGSLLNNGSDTFEDQGPTLVAPNNCQPSTPDYAVEAQIQVIQHSNCGCGFGLDARAISSPNGWQGYSVADFPCCGNIELNTMQQNTLAQTNFDPGSGYHSYRLEVKGNSVSLLIDGARILTQTDNRYLATGQVGLWCGEEVQISVRSFSVTVL